MKKLVVMATVAFAQISFASAVNYTNQIDLPSSSSQIKLVDAQYALVPTRTAVEAIPGCNPYANNVFTCDRTIVLESEAVVVANIAYVDSIFRNDNNTPNFTSVVLRTTDFSAQDIETLKSAYPQWKHPTSKIPSAFAAEKLNFTVQKVKRGVQVVDNQRSHFCATNDQGNTVPGCVENIVYKTSEVNGFLATVTAK